MKKLRAHLQENYASEPSSDVDSDGEDNIDNQHGVVVGPNRVQLQPFQHQHIHGHAQLHAQLLGPPHAHPIHHGFGPITGAYGPQFHHATFHPLPPPPPPLPPTITTFALQPPPILNPMVAPPLAGDDADEDLEEGDDGPGE